MNEAQVDLMESLKNDISDLVKQYIPKSMTEGKPTTNAMITGQVPRIERRRAALHHPGL